MVKDFVFPPLVGTDILVDNFQTHILEQELVGNAANLDVDERFLVCYLEFVLSKQMQAIGSQGQEVTIVLLLEEAFLAHQVFLASNKLNFSEVSCYPNALAEWCNEIRFYPERFAEG